MTAPRTPPASKADRSPTVSIVRDNARRDPGYCPYCMRCAGLIRMRKVAPFYWRCAKCGAEGDDRLAAVCDALHLSEEAPVDVIVREVEQILAALAKAREDRGIDPAAAERERQRAEAAEARVRELEATPASADAVHACAEVSSPVAVAACGVELSTFDNPVRYVFDCGREVERVTCPACRVAVWGRLVAEVLATRKRRGRLVDIGWKWRKRARDLNAALALATRFRLDNGLVVAADPGGGSWRSPCIASDAPRAATLQAALDHAVDLAPELAEVVALLRRALAPPDPATEEPKP